MNHKQSSEQNLVTMATVHQHNQTPNKRNTNPKSFYHTSFFTKYVTDDVTRNIVLFFIQMLFATGLLWVASGLTRERLCSKFSVLNDSGVRSDHLSVNKVVYKVYCEVCVVLWIVKPWYFYGGKWLWCFLVLWW